MHERPQGRGYIHLRERDAFPWPRLPDQAPEIHAHEFHHSAIVDPDPAWVYGYEVLRGSGVDGWMVGIIYKNLLASYAHLRHVGGRGMAGALHCPGPSVSPLRLNSRPGRIADKMTLKDCAGRPCFESLTKQT